ncbi:MAG TPA: iron-sulfur cluster repair di-iron protein [Candidatus Kapabacteria bacterium]|nr:iron-sulfur cluster repair di-iron protein [Candidatus Kapabacteria bacterium]
MEITKDSIISDLVATDYRTAIIFKKSGIDFCCKGFRSIEDACERKHIDSSKLIDELHDVSSQGKEEFFDYNSWSLDILADYIEKKHHHYVESKSREILPFLEKIVRVHGDRHPELREVETLFKETVGEMAKHMKKEELILFPFIKKMVKFDKENTKLETAPGRAATSIKAMMDDHTNEGDRFNRISELTNKYTAPEDGCNSYKITLAMLKEFEEDLYLHIHLENNILFPKSVLLEDKLNKAS